MTDSLPDPPTQDVREFYAAHGVSVLDLSHDQDSTDLCKCLSYIDEHKLATSSGPSGSSAEDSAAPGTARPAHHILVLGAMGGRLDHTLSNLNALYMYRHLHITLWGEGNLVRLLRQGSTAIRPFRPAEGPSCGLVPLTGPATASSSGLKWNLDSTRLEVGGLISTCNVMEGDAEIHVNTDTELLWMTTVSEQLG